MTFKLISWTLCFSINTGLGWWWWRWAGAVRDWGLHADKNRERKKRWTLLFGSSFRSMMSWLGLTSIKSWGRLPSRCVIFIKALPLWSLSPSATQGKWRRLSWQWLGLSFYFEPPLPPQPNNATTLLTTSTLSAGFEAEAFSLCQFVVLNQYENACCHLSFSHSSPRTHYNFNLMKNMAISFPIFIFVFFGNLGK